MADPSSALFVPHIIGIILDNEGVANSQVVAFNRRTGERQIARTSGDKAVIFDAASFTLGYAVNDIIEFNNVGASRGVSTITITDATGGFQEVSMDCAASPTVSVNL